MQFLGKRLRDIRKEKKISQKDLAVISKIDRGQISRIEKGKNDLQFTTLLRLASALQVEPVELLNNSKF